MYQLAPVSPSLNLRAQIFRRPISSRLQSSPTRSPPRQKMYKIIIPYLGSVDYQDTRKYALNSHDDQEQSAVTIWTRWRGIFNSNSNVTRPPVHNKRFRNSLLVVSSSLSVEIPRDRSDQPIRFAMYRALCARYKSLAIRYAASIPMFHRVLSPPHPPTHTFYPTPFFPIFSIPFLALFSTSAFLHRRVKKRFWRV